MQEKNSRGSETMPTSASAYVDDAAAFAKALTLADMVRAGDYGNAMRRVARKVGVCTTARQSASKQRTL